MKASVILVLLTVLSSLSIRAQEVTTPDFLVTNAGFLDNDPPIGTSILLVEQTVLRNVVNENQKNSIPVDKKVGTLLLDTSEAVRTLADTEQEYEVGELDYDSFYEVNDYQYFLEEGGLKLPLSW